MCTFKMGPLVIRPDYQSLLAKTRGLLLQWVGQMVSLALHSSPEHTHPRGSPRCCDSVSEWNVDDPRAARPTQPMDRVDPSYISLPNGDRPLFSPVTVFRNYKKTTSPSWSKAQRDLKSDVVCCVSCAIMESAAARSRRLHLHSSPFPLGRRYGSIGFQMQTHSPSLQTEDTGRRTPTALLQYACLVSDSLPPQTHTHTEVVRLTVS